MSAVKKAFKKIKKIGKKIRRATVPKFIRKIASKIKKSKFVRAIVVATAIYFTAGAALGAMGALSTGGSMLAGAKAGLASAWGGVTSAGTALINGKLGAAASSLGNGISGAYAAGAGTANAAGTIVNTANTVNTTNTMQSGGNLAQAAKTGGDVGHTFNATQVGNSTNVANTVKTGGGATKVIETGMTVGDGIQAAGLGMQAYGMYAQNKAGDSYSPNNIYGLDENGQAFNEAGMGELTMYNTMTGNNRYATGMAPPQAGTGETASPQAGVQQTSYNHTPMPQPGTQLNSIDDVIALQQREPHRITYS